MRGDLRSDVLARSGDLRRAPSGITHGHLGVPGSFGNERVDRGNLLGDGEANILVRLQVGRRKAAAHRTQQ